MDKYPGQLDQPSSSACSGEVNDKKNEISNKSDLDDKISEPTAKIENEQPKKQRKFGIRIRRQEEKKLDIEILWEDTEGSYADMIRRNRQKIRSIVRARHAQRSRRLNVGVVRVEDDDEDIQVLYEAPSSGASSQSSSVSAAATCSSEDNRANDISDLVD